jgi:branched-chain amino acid transport system permease protein
MLLASAEVPQQIVFGLGLGAIYALVALGFSLIYRSMGLLSLVHPQYVMLGSVFGYSFLVKFGLPLWSTVIPVALATGLASVVVDQIGMRPIRYRRGAEIAMIIATIGWGIVLVQTVSLTYGTDALSLRGAESHSPFSVLGVTIRWDTAAVLVTAAIFTTAFTLFLRLTRTGRAMRAVGENQKVAALMGINVERMLAGSAFVSGALGGVAGLYVGYIFVAGITAGDIGIKGLAAAVLGGFGNLPGALIGGFLFGLLDNLVAVYVNASWRDAIVFGFMILVLLVLPSGLLGRRRYAHA